MRTYWRLRAEHVREASTTVQRIQKVLTEMNLQLANVISDIAGLSGMAIIRAILAGERNPQKLASLCHARIQASPDQVAKSLEGNWRSDLLFVLDQQVHNYDHFQQRPVRSATAILLATINDRRSKQFHKRHCPTLHSQATSEESQEEQR